MKSLIRFLASAATGLVLALSVQMAHAVAVTFSTYSFVGNCSDCYQGEGQATAHLTLQNYTPGQNIEMLNFVSFTYDTTDLQPAYTITNPIVLMGGSDFGNLPGEAYFYIDDGVHFFNSQTGGGEGFWQTGESGINVNDFGFGNTWSVQTSGIPEPASLALIGLGLLGVAGARRRIQAKAA